ncbi:hypothetical protein ARC98_03350 [Escherichia coli]|nr:hypothetical protein ARC98_03350 [Escherichia coli]
MDTILNEALVFKLFPAGVKNTTAPVGLLNPSQFRKGFPALFTVLNNIGYEYSQPTDSNLYSQKSQDYSYSITDQTMASFS